MENRERPDRVVIDRPDDKVQQILLDNNVDENEQKSDHKLRAAQEEILRLKEENKEYKRRLEKYQKGMNMMRTGLQMIEGLHEDAGEKDCVGLSKSLKHVGAGEELPPIIQSQFEHFLPSIVSTLELTSFVRFINSSKKLYNLAESGYLNLTLNLNCTHSEIHSFRIPVLNDTKQQFFLIYEGRPLEPQMLSYIHRSPWIRVKIDFLDVVVWNEAESKRLQRLLEFMNIKSIDRAEIVMYVDIEFLKKFAIRKLKAGAISHTDCLRVPNVLKSEEVDFCFNSRDASDRATFGNTADQLNAMTFILNSSAYRIRMQRLHLAPSFVTQLAEMWLKGQMKFPHFQFGVSSVSTPKLHTDILMKNKVYVDMDLSQSTVSSIKYMLGRLKPMMIVGSCHTFILVREDLNILGVFGSPLDDRQSRPGETAIEVTMKAITNE